MTSAQRFARSLWLLSALAAGGFACGSTDTETGERGPSGGSEPGTAGMQGGGGSTSSGAGGGASSSVGGMAGSALGGAGAAAGDGSGAAAAGGADAGAGGLDGNGGAAGSAAGAGGSAGSGNGGSGGSAGAGGNGGSGGGKAVGTISLADQAPGFASVQGGTTGGGTDRSKAVTVSTMSALTSAAKASGPAIILLEPGNYAGTLTLSSDKTIIGKRPGVTITGNIRISGESVSNVIIRNLAVRGNRCNSYDECKEGADAVYVGDGAHHVWLDHLDIADGQDGNCDVTQGGDYVTISWSRFHYTYNKEHRFSNLIAGSDDEPKSVGKLRITYMNSYWGERVNQRQPRGRYGNVHMLNNYHKTGGSQVHGVGKDMALIAENNVYHESISIWTDMGSPRGWKGVGNEGTASNMNTSQGSVFTIPYQYEALPASKVVSAVTSSQCGAGNTCSLAD